MLARLSQALAGARAVLLAAEMPGMKRVAAGVGIASLVAIAVYGSFVGVVAVSRGEGHGPVFWTATAVNFLIVGGALLTAKRTYARYFAKPSQ